MNSLKSLKTSAVLCNGLKFQRCFGTSPSIRAATAGAKPAVTIPKAIPRGPTDILKALASTVQPDYTGQRYQYVDDPMLTPQRFSDRTSFIYSKEAGKKAARYFFDKYPQYFYRDISEPKIEAFTYREIYKDNMEFEIYDLERCLSTMEVSNSIVCYNGLRKQGVEIETDVLYDLLDLVCFYNCEDPPEQEIDEEIFRGRRGTSELGSKLLTNNWKTDGFAEQLFDSIEPKTSQMYSAMIRGLCRHGNIDKAFVLTEQAIEKKFPLNTGTFNDLISVVDRKYVSNDERWQAILKIFKTMNKNGIKPDLETMHNTLQQIERYVFWPAGFDNAKKVYNEFCFNFGIIPTRRTNFMMLDIQQGKDRQPGSAPGTGDNGRPPIAV